jgi:hypothetical protein
MQKDPAASDPYIVTGDRRWKYWVYWKTGSLTGGQNCSCGVQARAVFLRAFAEGHAEITLRQL